VEFVVLVLIVAAGIGAFFWWRSRQAAASKTQDAATEKTVANLEPGDGLAFWDGQNCLVDSVLRCTEVVNERVTEWQWVLLSDGRLLEIAPDANMVYDAPEVLQQGSEPFEQLTGERGVLRAFEQRVREEVAGSQPVHFQYGDVNYQVKSTGTFTAQVGGQPLTRDVWRDVSPNAGDNVYFEMAAESGAALGVWTTHIALYVGQPLRETDIDSIYPRQT
jgi:hypothetical protein